MTEGGIIYDRTEQTGDYSGGNRMQRAAGRGVCAAAAQKRMVVHGILRHLRRGGSTVRK